MQFAYRTTGWMTSNYITDDIIQCNNAIIRLSGRNELCVYDFPSIFNLFINIHKYANHTRKIIDMNKRYMSKRYFGARVSSLG